MKLFSFVLNVDVIVSATESVYVINALSVEIVRSSVQTPLQ